MNIFTQEDLNRMKPFCTGADMMSKTLRAVIASHELLLGGSHAFRALRAQMKNMTPEGRVEVFQQITEGYCKHCGTNNPHCQCENDE